MMRFAGWDLGAVGLTVRKSEGVNSMVDYWKLDCGIEMAFSSCLVSKNSE
jgi:hypothetical protein